MKLKRFKMYHFINNINDALEVGLDFECRCRVTMTKLKMMKSARVFVIVKSSSKVIQERACSCFRRERTQNWYIFFPTFTDYQIVEYAYRIIIINNSVVFLLCESEQKKKIKVKNITIDWFCFEVKTFRTNEINLQWYAFSKPFIFYVCIQLLMYFTHTHRYSSTENWNETFFCAEIRLPLFSCSSC